jgi:hypothetical protein
MHVQAITVAVPTDAVGDRSICLGGSQLQFALYTTWSIGQTHATEPTDRSRERRRCVAAQVTGCRSEVSNSTDMKKLLDPPAVPVLAPAPVLLLAPAVSSTGPQPVDVGMFKAGERFSALLAPRENSGVAGHECPAEPCQGGRQVVLGIAGQRRWCTRRMGFEMTPVPVRHAMTRGQRMDFGRPAASIRFRNATPKAASVCWAAKPRARIRGPTSAL